MRSQAALITAAFCIATLAMCGSAKAYTPRVVLDLSNGASEVEINDHPAVRFKTANGALSRVQRATITAQRLQGLVAAKFDPMTINVKGDKQQARIYAGEALVCIVTRADAQVDRTTPLALASSWASNMRRLMQLPGIVLSDRSIMVPAGEFRRVFVGGAANGQIVVKSSVEGIAVSTVDARNRVIEVRAQQVGATQLEVSVDGERAVFEVTVKQYAGTVPAVSFAEVTGSPCPSSMIKYAAEQAVIRNADLEPGARVEAQATDGLRSALGAGTNRSVKVSVKISGEGFITYGNQVSVEVHNSVMPMDQPGQLFYSNAPERLERYQVLFMAKLQADMSTRVLYHHQNAIGKPVNLVVDITNPSDLPATYRITSCAAGPMVDTVLVGYLASRSFLQDVQLNASVIERVPPKSRLVIVSDMLRQLDTSSGVLQIKQTDGRESYVRVAALPPGLENVIAGSIASPADITEAALSDHVYPVPAKLVEADYIIGQRWAFIAIGKHALGSHNALKKLDGNYGVTYDINVKVQNPTDQTKKVRVMFDPTAGLASGVFIIDGELVSTKYAKPPDEFQLASFQLGPGKTRSINIKTVPVAGSNYPANLVVRS